MEKYKVLSINPGAAERLPAYKNEKKEATTSIVPMADRVANIFGYMDASYVHGSASRLLLRVVAAVAICCAAVYQMQGGMNVFGVESASTTFGAAALVLGIMMATGVAGRGAALGLVALSVTAVISYAYANGGVADFSPTNQLTIIYGALAAMVAVLGTGSYTLTALLSRKFHK